MIIVDVETSGTDPRYHSLVSIGAIDFDNPSDSFFKECRIFPGARVGDEALAVNGMTLEEINDQTKQSDAEIVAEFIEWIKDKRDHTVAGQNPSFDVGFILAGAERAGLNISLAHRTIDLHSLVHFHMSERGIVPPVKNNRTDLNSDTIMRYVGIEPEPKPHIAINGAKWEAEAFSRLYNNKSMFTEFEYFKIPWN